MLMLLQTNVFAQEAIFYEHEFIYNNESDKINSLAICNKGFLYIGTNQCVFYYDGISYHKALPDKLTVQKLFFDSENRLWIADAQSKVYLFQNNKLVLKAQLKANVSDIIQDKQKNIWVSTYGDGLVKFHSTSNKITKVNLTDPYVYDLLLLNNDLYVASDNKINIVNTINLKSNACAFNNYINDEIVTSLAFHVLQNCIYIGTQSKGLFQYQIQSKKIIPIAGSTNFGSIQKIIPKESTLWLITEDSALVKYSREHDYTAFNKKNGSFVSAINDVATDKEGNLWLCNSSSTIYSFNSIFERIQFSNSKIKECNAIYRDSKSRIWFSTNTELYYYHQNKLNKVFDASKKLGVISIHEDFFGNMWFGTFDKGLICYDTKIQKLVIYNDKNALNNNNILSIASIDNTLWLATLGGISRLTFTKNNQELSSVQNYANEQSIGTNFIYKVYVDSKKRVWFATDGKGLSMFDGKRFYNYSKKEGLKSKNLYSITEDNKGVIWLASAKDGIYSFDGQNFRNYNRSMGLRSLKISGLIADRHNNLLIVSDVGIDIMNLETKEILYHDTEIGFKNTSPFLNANMLDNYGNIWIGTSSGIIKYNSESNKLSAGPIAVFTEFRVNAEKRKMENHSLFKHDENFIQFSYNGLWYHKPSEVRYKIQLKGYDVQSIETKDHSITYSKLPPGKYEFVLQCTASNTFKNANTIRYSFTIDYPFWQKAWFIVLFVFVIMLGIYIFIKWRTRVLQEKQQFEKERIVFELETLRNQINPHFLFNSFNTLAGIVETNPLKAVVFIEKLSDFYRELLTYRERNLINLTEELKLLENYIFLIEQRFINKIKFELQIPLEYFEKKVAPLSLQLLIENAIKHNTASREHPLTIKIYCEGAYLIVQNKIYLKSSGVVSTGIGLNNIAKRYELLSDKNVEIINDGNIFTVKIPLID